MLSLTIEYALSAMRSIASLEGAAKTNESIATIENIPSGYLSKIMRDLVRAELVKSFRGPNGGFLLARDPREITLLDIINAVDPIRRPSRGSSDSAHRVKHCPLRRRLDHALVHLEEELRSTSLMSALSGGW